MVRRKKIDWPKHIFIIIMLAWAIAHFLIFWVYVNANSFVLTFFKFNTATAKYEWYGLTRFENIFNDMILGQDPLVVQNLKNSLLK